MYKLTHNISFSYKLNIFNYLLVKIIKCWYFKNIHNKFYNILYVIIYLYLLIKKIWSKYVVWIIHIIKLDHTQFKIMGVPLEMWWLDFEEYIFHSWRQNTTQFQSFTNLNSFTNPTYSIRMGTQHSQPYFTNHPIERGRVIQLV